jgi:4-hydroxybenzoate polyprenyltransferase
MAAYTNGLPLNAYWIGIGKALVGAFLLRSSACTINDFFDRKVDAGVGKLNRPTGRPASNQVSLERSKGRPLASGRISVPAALLYLFAQYAVGVAFFYYTEHGLAYVILKLLFLSLLMTIDSLQVALIQLIPL